VDVTVSDVARTLGVPEKDVVTALVGLWHQGLLQMPGELLIDTEAVELDYPDLRGVWLGER
jgi:DNA-binding IclR family transcriptional regulator